MINKNRIAMIANIREVASNLKRPPTRNEYFGFGCSPIGKFSQHSVMKEFGQDSWKKFLDHAKLRGPRVVSVLDATGFEISKLKTEVSSLKNYIKDLEGEAVNTKSLRKIIGAIDYDGLGGDSDWLIGAKNPKSNLTGIPTLFLSDIHFDEVVSPEQIGKCNEYNREIATKRIQHTFKTTIQLLKYHMAKPKYDGIICALGGDMTSGVIHEELSETNEDSISQTIFKLADLLIVGIGCLADEFGKVFVPCVVGNHGRQHKKPRMKNRVFDNYEWIIYQIISRYFKNDKRVSVLIPDGADAIYKIYDQRICLTHGDQFKGGAGIAGIFSPLMLGMARKQRREAAINQSFDLLIMGHFHQLIMSQSLIVNGSIKGMDEYAYIGNFPYERPQQALFITHPDKGINYRMPILCDGYEKKKSNSASKLIIW